MGGGLTMSYDDMDGVTYEEYECLRKENNLLRNKNRWLEAKVEELTKALAGYEDKGENEALFRRG
jgi:BMFP domain-containing protein YqiC